MNHSWTEKQAIVQQQNILTWKHYRTNKEDGTYSHIDWHMSYTVMALSLNPPQSNIHTKTRTCKLTR